MIPVYNRATGKKNPVVVPEVWLSIFPNLARVPSSRPAPEPAPTVKPAARRRRTKKANPAATTKEK